MLHIRRLSTSPLRRPSVKILTGLGVNIRSAVLQHQFNQGIGLNHNLRLKFSYIRLHDHLRLQQHACGLCGFVHSNYRRTQLRFYASSTQNDESEEEGFISDSEFDIDDYDRDQVLGKDQLDLLRVNLYQKCEDPVVQALSSAASVQEVFDVIERSKSALTVQQTSQAIVTLWDLQKVFGRYTYENLSISNPKLTQFLEKISNHSVFHRLVEQLEVSHQELDNNALACMLLYLHRIGVKNSSSLMQKLTSLCLLRIENFNLSALSRLTVFLRDQGLKSYFLQSKALPLILLNIRKCSTSDELKLITICLSCTRKLITKSLMKEYEDLVHRLFEQGIFLDCEVKVVIKILKFLSYPEWSTRGDFLSRKLLISLAEKVSSLTPEHVIALSQHCQSYLEPRDVLQKIQEQASKLIEENKSSTVVPDLLLCLAPYCSLKVRRHLEELVAEQLDHKNIFDRIPVIFKILRYIKTSNIKLCNAFWTKSLRAVEQELRDFPEPYLGYEEVMLRSVYHRYMYFNNNLGGTYRHYYLERNITKMLFEALQGNIQIIPSKVARMASFIISYNDGSGLPEELVNQIIDLAPQLSIFDTIVLSRGIQISLAFHPNNTQRTYTNQITTLNRMLNSCTERHIQCVSSLLDVTSITRAYLGRKGSSRTFLYEKLLSSHIPFMNELNSRHLRNIVIYLQYTRFLSPEILDVMAQYIIENQDFVLHDTVERFLTCIYNLGYVPASGNKFFKACINVLPLGCHHLPGLNSLQACLALAFYNYLPSEMIHTVFSINFLDQLDEEIDACYSKATYPSRVRHLLMELNRTVCIDYPEENVPWFHEKYCEELLETVAVSDSAFHTEVHQVLNELVGGADVVRANVKTPYFYLLDFEFVLDETNRPVPASLYANSSKNKKTSEENRIESTPGYRRVAVLLRKENSYCINSRSLIGRHQLERRHLEVLGYTVIEIPHFMWHSMALSTYEDKVQYLKGIIYPEMTS